MSKKVAYEDLEDFTPSKISHAEELYNAGVPVSTILKMAGAMALTYSPEERAEIIAHNLEGTKGIDFGRDKYGNSMIQVNGNKYYINKPGIHLNDVIPYVVDGATLAVAPEIKGASLLGEGIAKGASKLVGKTAGNLASKSAGYGGYAEAKKMAVNEAQDKPIYNDNDLVESAAEGVLGGALDMGGGALINKLKGSKASAAEIANSPDFIKEMIKNGGDDAELAHAFITGRLPNENGIPLTKGQADNNTKQIALENAGKTSTRSEKAQSLMNSFGDIQQKALDNQLLNINKQFNPNANLAASNFNNAGSSVLNAFNNSKELAEKAVNDAYSKVKLHEITLPSDKNNLKQVIDNNTDQNLMQDIFNDYPDYAKTVNHINQVLPQINSMQDIEAIRQGLNNKINTLINSNPNLDKAKDPLVRAYSMLKNGIDNHIDELANNGSLGGSKEAINDLKNARGLNTQYNQLFNFGRGKAGANSLLSSNLDDNLTSEKLLNLLTSSSPAGSTKAIGAIKRIKDTLGENSPEVNELKEHYLLKMFAPDVNESGNLATNTSKAINNYNNYFLKNNSVTKELYTPEELNGIHNFASQLNTINSANSVKAATPAGDIINMTSTALHHAPLGFSKLSPFIDKLHPAPEQAAVIDSLGLKPSNDSTLAKVLSKFKNLGSFAAANNTVNTD
ncbi:hypothetical protein ACFX5K_01365 [Rickettsiales bacterium LUAb2]